MGILAGENSIWFLWGMVVGSLVGVLINAAILRYAAHLAQNLSISFEAAVATQFVVYFLNAAIGIGVGGILITICGGPEAALILFLNSGPMILGCLLPVSLLIQCEVIRSRHNLTFAKAVNVVGFMLLVGLLVALLLAVVAGGIALLVMMNTRPQN